MAEAIGLSVDQAAEGILAIVNENMAGALRVISVQRGHDPREFALVAFGGAGPLHANAVAELMGSFPVIVPPVARAAVRARRPRGRLPQRVRADADPPHARGRRGGGRAASSTSSRGGRARWMDAESIPAAEQSVTFVADMRYHGQGYEIPVAMERDVAVLDERFNDLHEQLYGFRMPDTPSEIVNLRAIGTGARPSPELPQGEPDGGEPAAADAGEILFEGERRHTPIFDRGALQPGHRLSGPAIVTEFDSTTVVLPGYAAEVDRYFNILIRPEERMIMQSCGSPRSRPSRSTRSRSTSSRTRCATRASRWTRCSSAPP